VALTKIQPNIIAVANNVTNKTVGNTTSIPSFTFDGAGVVTSASNVAISGAGITANTVANSAFQTGSVENYLRGANLDFGMRNRIINGAMTVSQRWGANAVSDATNTNPYTVDRWSFYGDPASKVTLQQNQGSVTPPAGFINYMGLTSTSAYTPAAGDAFRFQQIIEGLNIADLGWGTANAKPVTLSFWVRSSLTGTFGGALSNSSLGRSYPFSYTINSANTWEYETITIPGDTTGTWLTTNGNGIRVFLDVGCGSTTKGPASAWASAFYAGVSGGTNVVATNGATFQFTGVQLEEGSQATSFEYRQYGTELALCQRYYEIWRNSSTEDGSGITNGSIFNTRCYAAVKYAVSKRTAPTLEQTGSKIDVVTAAHSLTNSTIDEFYSPNTETGRLRSASSGSFTNGQSGLVSLGTSSYIAFNAEL
jgi:hypothetical protein